jgi:hypothetical protein
MTNHLQTNPAHARADRACSLGSGGIYFDAKDARVIIENFELRILKFNLTTKNTKNLTQKTQETQGMQTFKYLDGTP